MEKREEWIVWGSNKSLTLGLFLKETLQISQREIRKALENSQVKVDGRWEKKASQRVNPGQKITYLYREVQSFEKDSVKILWEDGDAIVIHKPSGFLCGEGTKLFEAVAQKLPCNPFDLKWVHRLDKETSGLLLLARSSLRAQWLMERFQKREVHKVYYAICHQGQGQEKATVKDYLSAFNSYGEVKIVKSGGQLALMNYEVCQKSSRGWALLKCEPKTGRSHQIRVQLASRGWPIWGDKKYGHFSHMAPRHLLHARSLGIQISPHQQQIQTFKSPWPKDFEDVLGKDLSIADD